MNLVSEVIFVDESGNASLSKEALLHSNFFSLGFVYCKSPIRMRVELKRLLKRLQKRNHYPKKLKELKFYLPNTELMGKYGYSELELTKYLDKMDANRRKMISIINKNAIGIHAAVCIKSTVHRDKFTSAEILGNWLFANTLCKWIVPNIACKHPVTIIFDKGRLTAAKCDNFKLYLKDKERYLKVILFYTALFCSRVLSL